MRVRRAVAAGLASAVLLATAACGGSEEPSTKDSPPSSATASTSTSPSASASPTAGVTGTGGRILLVPADAPGRMGRCTPAPKDGVVCSSDKTTTYRFQPDAVRTLRVTTAVASYQDQVQTWVVQMKVDAVGARALTALTTTAARTRQQLLVLLPGTRRLLSAPQVNDPITGGDLQITGDFTRAEAAAIVRQITSTAG